jgi:hypothetical protein
MKPHIVANGPQRLMDNEKYQEHLRQLRAEIRARYASDLAHAGFLRRCLLRLRMRAEYRRELPPTASLFVSRLKNQDNRG